jgi:hypothetical protein
MFGLIPNVCVLVIRIDTKIFDVVTKVCAIDFAPPPSLYLAFQNVSITRFHTPRNSLNTILGSYVTNLLSLLSFKFQIFVLHWNLRKLGVL